MKVEREWECFGCRCMVGIMAMGHRCGYVSVSLDNPLYGVRYDDLPDGFEPGVNGGITYSRWEIGGDRWVFGFDYDHCWDIPDDACIEYYAECNPGIEDRVLEIFRKGVSPDARVATLEMAIDDCNRLAEYLDSWIGRKYVLTIDDFRYGSLREPDEIICKGIRYVPEYEA